MLMGFGNGNGSASTGAAAVPTNGRSASPALNNGKRCQKMRQVIFCSILFQMTKIFQICGTAASRKDNDVGDSDGILGRSDLLVVFF